MTDTEHYERLTALRRPRGDAARALRIGRWTISFEGLDAALAQELTRRWGPFVSASVPSHSDVSVRALDSGDSVWLDGEFYGERYRLEVHGAAERRVVLSYHFALCAAPDEPARFLLAMNTCPREPVGRMMENVARYLLAELALDRGGFAMHGAGVLHDGRAYLYAGPSRSGKSTAVASSVPAASLGDDFALVVKSSAGWLTPAVPFNSSECVESTAPRGLYPVAGVWRLHQATATRVERPTSGLAVASLLSCTAFPWAYPERARELLEHARGFVEECHFAHLHFGLSSNLHEEFLRDADSEIDTWCERT